jgi:hypothetical protein
MGQLDQLVRRLEKFHGAQAGPLAVDPYQLLLWEYVAYLADDEKRLAAYQLLARTVGTEPAKILAAPSTVLLEVTRAGGSIAAELRATRIQDLAARVVDDWDGDLSPVSRLPFEQARRELARFRSIGEAGAEGQNHSVTSVHCSRTVRRDSRRRVRPLRLSDVLN